MNSTTTEPTIKLTLFSHGSGCGCKISPKVLNAILSGSNGGQPFENLLVGYGTRDDAAVMAIDENQAIVSTTDFFMPILDDPHDFGRIAAVNAISDVYAMGGSPIMAISILGWPIDKIPPEVAAAVVDGAREVCHQAKIPLAGGHSIDAPEPIFGLANSTGTEGCELYMTKPLGVGIYTTAQKRNMLRDRDLQEVRALMLTLNKAGEAFGRLDAVKAMTDVTGFGLLGHLIELCEGSGLSAQIDFDSIPRMASVEYYMERRCIPGGTNRNYESYGEKVSPMSDDRRNLLCDPQTSGGLLVAVDPAGRKEFSEAAARQGLSLKPFGSLKQNDAIVVSVKG